MRRDLSENSEPDAQPNGGNEHALLAEEIPLAVRIDDSEADDPHAGQPLENDPASSNPSSERERRFRVEERRVPHEIGRLREDLRDVGVPDRKNVRVVVSGVAAPLAARSVQRRSRNAIEDRERRANRPAVPADCEESVHPKHQVRAFVPAVNAAHRAESGESMKELAAEAERKTG